MVPIRGKMDMRLERRGKNWLREFKCKGWIDEVGLLNTLHMNIQTGIYLVALRNMYGPVGGVLYDVIRRPLAEKHTIRQRKDETKPQFIERIIKIVEDNQSDYFKRWQIVVTEQDLNRFEQYTMRPLLAEFVRWWEWIKDHQDNPFAEGNTIHWMRPFGIFDGADWGTKAPYFKLITEGSKIGLVRNHTLFPELEET